MTETAFPGLATPMLEFNHMLEEVVLASWTIDPTHGFSGSIYCYRDGSAEFSDDSAIRRELGHPLAFILSEVFGERQKRRFADLVCRHTFPVRIEPPLFSRIVAASAEVSRAVNEDEPEPERLRQECDAIDLELDTIFWRDINLRLTRPLDGPGLPSREVPTPGPGIRSRF